MPNQQRYSNRDIGTAKGQQLDRQVKAYLLSVIDSEGFENEPYFNECKTDSDKISFLSGRFKSEYQYNVTRYGQLKAMTDWLQGLAINVEYANYKILRLAVEWGSIPEDATEGEESKILANYWNLLANKLLQLFRNKG